MVAVVKKKKKNNELSAQEQIDQLASQGKNALKEIKYLENH